MNGVTPVDLRPVARELSLSLEQVQNVVALLDEGNTVPFITRYRKERTGNLDEEQIRRIQERASSVRQLVERAQTITRLIDSQGKLTPELRAAIASADSLKRLEDLYLPYRPKRRTRGTTARERGLEPFADRIWLSDPALSDLDRAAEQLVDPGKELPSKEDVLQGASDILAERIADDAEVREAARGVAWKSGRLTVSATKSGRETGQDYRDYFEYSEQVSRVPPHRCLAINRGEEAGALRVRLEWDDVQANSAVSARLGLEQRRFSNFLERCVADSLERLILPSLEREIRKELTERAEAQAVSVFAQNLKNLLLQAPLSGRRVVAIDPGFRTGCKLVALDEFGKLLGHDVIYVSGPADKRAQTREKLAGFLREHHCRVIAIGNGTACRECEELISETIAEQVSDAQYVIVNEAGASVYSASLIAREEFPDLDATVRGTISIGRRLLDPLSELVKIEPQHIGVGMYQHDVSPKMLQESLDHVIESCVNYVGVDLNTASASLLRYVSGFNQLIARRVVAWRDEHGRFANRKQLREVQGIGDATFTQSAGFLKITGGEEPLDGTWIHPESYAAARKVLNKLALPETPGATDVSVLSERIVSTAEIADEVGVGLPTLKDILDALSRPGRDPRSDTPGPLFKQGVIKLEDLSEGMELRGTVLNVVDFGVFVDVGLKDSGLVHISQLARRFVRSPHEIAAVGDVVTVWVLGVDLERRRVSLSMIPPGTARENLRGRTSIPQSSPSGPSQKESDSDAVKSEKKPAPTAEAAKPADSDPAPA
ncbi:MAG: Tex family protein, partial [Planctomycetaceae bacterium]